MNRKFLLLFLSFILTYSTAWTQLPDSLWSKYRLNVGLTGGQNRINNTLGVPVIPFTSDCGNYTDGKGNGFYFGLDFQYELYKDWIAVYGRPYYEQRPATLRAESRSYEVFAPQTNSYEALVRQHTWEGTLEYMILDFGIKLKPMSMVSAIPQVPDLSYIPWFIRVGFEAGDPIVGTEFTNEERILEPSGVLFPDQRLTRSVDAGEVKQAGNSRAINIATGADISLKGGLMLSPEVSYRHELNSPIPEFGWGMDIIRFGMTVSWQYRSERTLTSKPKPEPKPEPEPEPKLESEVIAKTDIPIPVLPMISNLKTIDVDLVETVVT